MSSEDPKPKRGYFRSVAAAREALKARAHEILKLYIHNAKVATKNKDYETAQKSYQWLLEHMPADDLGERVVVHSIDKAVESTGKLQPSIQIGINVGGLAPDRRLNPAKEPVVVDITPLKEESK